MDTTRLIRIVSLVSALCCAMIAMAATLRAAPFSEFVDPNPAPGNQFGSTVVPLSTGNVVVTSPFDDAGGVDAGAVYLFNGSTGALISTLIGSTASDQVGGSGSFGVSGVTALKNGNFVVITLGWDNGAAVDAGAVTWGSGTTGVSGTVSAANSLVGSTTGDLQFTLVGVLSNGNYVVTSPRWDNGAIVDAGAVTWGSGTLGVRGTISAANSLVGSRTDDLQFVRWTPLANGNYVVASPRWDNGAIVEAGAVTWGSGTAGVSGTVSAANSLVGSSAFEFVGDELVTALSNGNYVVTVPRWDNGSAFDAGAVTWGNGTTGVRGTISAANSLVGSRTNDGVGNIGVTALSNGNYVVTSLSWDNGAIVDASAVTWGNGNAGVTGAVSAANSLVGSATNDRLGSGGVLALSNGNYVVRSPVWDSGGAFDAGAVTWGNGTTGVSGAVSAANSLVGSTASDLVGGNGVVALSNGNYVVASRFWHNGTIVNAGAVTWGDGTAGVSGAVSSANSLVGSTAGDLVGSFGVVGLSNGNYVVLSPSWRSGGAFGGGAVTWGSGATGVTGAVSPANSLVGSAASNLVGYGGVTELSNGNFLVLSPLWNNGAGAVTWGNGTAGVTGVVSAANSLVGATAGDQVGTFGVVRLSNGNYVVRSPFWNHDAGAVTWGNGTAGATGVVSAATSLVGAPGDQVGSGGVVPLSNGNYVVLSSFWDNGGVLDAGAVTWGNGNAGVTGAVSAANSLVGSTPGDGVGDGGATALSNGNYVVASPRWGAIDGAGAVTWGNGTAGVTGPVSAANSLVGSRAGDGVGDDGVWALSNGNYVVLSANRDNGAIVDAGAVTWGSGTTGVRGAISVATSLLGTTANTNLQRILVLDDVNKTFMGRFLAEGGGRVRVGLQADGVLCPPIPMSLDLAPNTLNLQSLGHWVTAILEPDPPASPGDIDIASILLNGSVPTDASAPTSMGDADNDGRPDLTVKFDRAAVELTVAEGEAVTVTVTGVVGNGCFGATDVIRVVRAHVTAPGAGAVLQGGRTAEVRWDTPTGVQALSVALLWSSDDGASWASVAKDLPNSGSYLWTVPGSGSEHARLAVVLVESAHESGFLVTGVLGMSQRFVITTPLGVDGASVSLSLQGSVPNPSRDLTVSFTLPGAEPATLVVYDVNGREVSRRQVGSLGAGRHVVALAAERALAPGIYFVNLIQGERCLKARAVVIR